MQVSQISRIALSNVSQSFVSSEHQVRLFKDLNLTLIQGESYAITGPSGSGKSSLLMLMSGLEKPTTGQVTYLHDGHKLALNDLREDIGFIFQQFHLLPELDALNNVALPLKLRGIKGAHKKATYWLEKVGLGNRLKHKPQQLSGGEQQRVAIARALVFTPKFIFADEPTGNLDTQSAKEIADLLFSCCQEKGAGLIMVTHSEALASRAEHIFRFRNGTCELAEGNDLEVQYA